MAESNVAPNTSNTKVRTLVITPDGGQPFLLVEVEIDCAVCGRHEYRIAGHHLASLAASFQRIVEDHGKLAGKLGRKVDEAHWEGSVDPRKAGLN